MQGLQVQDYFGNFHKGTPTDLDLPAVCFSSPLSASYFGFLLAMMCLHKVLCFRLIVTKLSWSLSSMMKNFKMALSAASKYVRKIKIFYVDFIFCALKLLGLWVCEGENLLQKSTSGLWPNHSYCIFLGFYLICCHFTSSVRCYTQLLMVKGGSVLQLSLFLAQLC